LTTAGDDFIWNKSRITGMVDVNAIDDSLVRVVKVSGLSGLKEMESDYFAAGYNLCSLHCYYLPGI
jgi:hypothetical protein